MNQIYRIFCWASGARIYLLKKVPTEWNKYLGIGIIVTLTGIMAGLSGSYALFTVFRDPIPAITLGIFWGVFVFFLDWFFIASMKSSAHNLQIILPRLLFGVFLAFIIVKPLELRLFQNEIKQQLMQEQQTRQKAFKQQLENKYPELAELKQKNKELRNEIAEKEAKRAERYQAIIEEAEGRSPTGMEGKGPVYKEKKQELDRISANLKTLKERNNNQIEANKERMQAINRELEQEMQTYKEINSLEAGFLEQFAAFREIAKHNPVIQAVNVFIVLLFILVELSPLLVKILSPYGPYDKLLDAEENKAKTEADSLHREASLKMKKNISLQEELNGMEYAFNIEQKRDYLEKKQKEGQELNSELVKRWKNKALGKWTPNKNNGNPANGKAKVPEKNK